MALPPKVPEATSLDGTETMFGIKGGKWVGFASALLKGLKGDKGDKGDKGNTGDAGAPKRVERYTATTNASGVATFTFSPAFTAAPDVQVIDGWAADQMIAGGVTAVSTTSCTVQAKISRGTLLLTSGPFQTAAAGVSVTIRAIGN